MQQHKVGRHRMKIVFCLLILLTGIVEGNDECNINPALRCDLNFRFPFPESEDDIISTCNSFKANLQCFLNLTKTCGGDENQIRRIGNILIFTDTICQEKSPIYKNVVSSLSCLKPIFHEDYKECTKTDDTKAMKFFTYLMELSEKGIKNASDNDRNSQRCLDTLYYKACSAAEVGMKCGSEARDSVVNIMQNLDFKLKICKQEIVDDLMTLVNKFESPNK